MTKENNTSAQETKTKTVNFSFPLPRPRTIQNVYARVMVLCITSVIVIPLLYAVIAVCSILGAFIELFGQLFKDIKQIGGEIGELWCRHWKSFKVMCKRDFVATSK